MRRRIPPTTAPAADRCRRAPPRSSLLLLAIAALIAASVPASADAAAAAAAAASSRPPPSRNPFPNPFGRWREGVEATSGGGDGGGEDDGGSDEAGGTAESPPSSEPAAATDEGAGGGAGGPSAEEEEEGEAGEGDAEKEGGSAAAAESAEGGEKEEAEAADAPAGNQTSPIPTQVIFMRSPQRGSFSGSAPALFGSGSLPISSPYGPSSPSGSPSELTTTAVALAASVLSLATRLILLCLLYGINPFGSPERAYCPGPTQHYAFERINDRYGRDGAALRRALDCPPPPRYGVRARRWRRSSERRRRAHRRELRAASSSSSASAAAAAGAASAAEKGGGAGDAAPPGNGGSGGSGGGGGGSPPAGDVYSRTVIVLDFCPPSRSSADPQPYHGPHPHPDPVEALRDQVSFVLSQVRDPTVRPYLGRDVEVVLRIESPGGLVHDYGLAADQVARLRAESAGGGGGGGGGEGGGDGDGDGDAGPGGLTLTVCVDRVAASGGYMVACQSSPGRLYAAPFAAVGSVGVLREGINVHDALTRVGVRPLVLRAGEYKVPLDMLGEVTDADVGKVQRDMERVHGAFQRLVTDARPGILRPSEGGESGGGGGGEDEGPGGALAGEVYLGREAARRGLVDRVVTSDEYLAERVAAGDRVLRLYRVDRSKFGIHLNPLDLLLFGGGGAKGGGGRGGGALARHRSRFLARAPPGLLAAARVGGTIGLANVLRLLGGRPRRGPGDVV